MADDNSRSVPAHARVPLHLLLNPVAIALFAGALGCDLVFSQTGLGAVAAFWLVGAGLAMMGVTSAVGVVDLIRDPRIMDLPDAGIYLGGFIAGGSAEGFSWTARYFKGLDAVVPMGLELSLISLLCLLIMVWTGRRIWPSRG